MVHLILITTFFTFISHLGAQICYLPTSFNCNETTPLCPGATEIIALPGTVYNCRLALTLQADSLTLSGTFSGLNLTANTISISSISISYDLNVTCNTLISMQGEITVTGSIVIMSSQTNGSAFTGLDESISKKEYQAVIQLQGAVITCNKIVIIGMNNITLVDSTISTTFNLCLYSSINVHQLSNNISQLIDTMNGQGIAQLNFSVFFFASNGINLQGSVITAVSQALLSSGNMKFNESTLNSSAQSCRANNGIGRGTNIQYLNTYCTSGSSSCGYGSISNASLCADIIQYFMFLSHSFPYISKGPYLSTGSGGYGYSQNGSRSGAGGGIIFILSEENISLNDSNILAAGGNVGVNDMLSAGSGGTIFITSRFIQAFELNEVSAGGGNSSNNNGSGGGGLIKISFQEIYPFNIWVNINEGIQNNAPGDFVYSNGIFYGPTCPLGHQAYYLGCEICPPGTYSGLGDPICRPCPKIISLQINNQSYGNQYVSECYRLQHVAKITAWLTPGDLSLLSILLYLILLIVFTIIGAILKKKIKKQRYASVDEFSIEDVKRDLQKSKILAVELRQVKTIKPHQLMYHVHRISCFGTNSEQSPWILPTTVPEEVRKYVHVQVFQNFAQSFNEQARWTSSQYWMAKLCCLIYPFYWYYLDKVKHRKFNRLLTKLQHAKDYNLLNNYNYQDRSIITIKFSKNKDYTNCYLDFFVYERADYRYFTLSSPFLIYLSGQGNFLRPYYLEEDDLFFKMMYFVVNRTVKSESEYSDDEKLRLFSNMASHKIRQKNSRELARFLRKFNTLACTLDLSAPTKTVVGILWNLFELVDKWNRCFFNQMAVHVDLLLMISRLMEGTIIDNDVQVPTNNNRAAFEACLHDKLQKNKKFQHTLKIALFVYNPQQQLLKEQQPDILIQELEQSMVERQDSMRESLIQAVKVPENGIRANKKHKSRSSSWLSRLRYLMLSHQKTHYDEYTIKFLQSLFILIQTMLVFIWSIKLEVPYVFVNLVCPFIGIIWFVSDSYGFGKLYLILLAMTLLNQVVTLCFYSVIQAIIGNSDAVARTIICSSVNILVIVLMLFIGRRAITLSKKLSLKKEEKPQPRQ